MTEKRKWGEMGLQWCKERAIVVCPHGHEIDFFRESGVDEWGQRIGVNCVECAKERNGGWHVSALKKVRTRDKIRGEDVFGAFVDRDEYGRIINSDAIELQMEETK